MSTDNVIGRAGLAYRGAEGQSWAERVEMVMTYQTEMLRVSTRGDNQSVLDLGEALEDAANALLDLADHISAVCRARRLAGSPPPNPRERFVEESGY